MWYRRIVGEKVLCMWSGLSKWFEYGCCNWSSHLWCTSRSDSRQYILSNTRHYHLKVQAFIYGELRYACQAKIIVWWLYLMIKDDSHCTLQFTTRLLLALSNCEWKAILTLCNLLTIVEHCPCTWHVNITILPLLFSTWLTFDITTLNAVDKTGNTFLHLACRGARYDTIALLLEKYGAVSVSKRNARDKFPIERMYWIHREGLSSSQGIPWDDYEYYFSAAATACYRYFPK